jgi:hypothetical protein
MSDEGGGTTVTLWLPAAHGHGVGVRPAAVDGPRAQELASAACGSARAAWISSPSSATPSVSARAARGLADLPVVAHWSPGGSSGPRI